MLQLSSPSYLAQATSRSSMDATADPESSDANPAARALANDGPAQTAAGAAHLAGLNNVPHIHYCDEYVAKGLRAASSVSFPVPFGISAMESRAARDDAGRVESAMSSDANPAAQAKADQRRVAWDNSRYPREDWLAWYEAPPYLCSVAEVDAMFEAAPDYLSIVEFMRAGGIYYLVLNGRPILEVEWKHEIARGRLDGDAINHWTVGLAFAGCLVVFPIEYAARLGYLSSTAVPRQQTLRIGENGIMIIYDLRKDAAYFTKVRLERAWLSIDFERTSLFMFDVLRGVCQPDESDVPFYEFLCWEGVGDRR